MEIEIRAFVKDMNLIEKKIIELGGKLSSTQHIVDFWFCKDEFNKFEQVQQKGVGSYALRIRKKLKKDNEFIELNCKVLEKVDDHNAFHEYETKIDNLDQTKKILESIGFKVFCVIDKERKKFILDDCSINLENIKGFRPAIELEIIADDNIEDHKIYLHELLSKLGIKDEDKIEKSITYLYMKEFAFKD